MAMQPKFIVIYGDPVSGLSFVGPFNNSTTASEWGEHSPLGADWWIAPMILPEDFDTGPID